MERNIKPSEILRQKSSDSLDQKLAAVHRKTTPDIGMYSKSSELTTDEICRKVVKAESLEKTRRPEIGKTVEC